MNKINCIEAVYEAISKIGTKEDPITNRKEYNQALMQLKALAEMNKRDAIAASLVNTAKKTASDDKKSAMEHDKVKVDLYKFKVTHNISIKPNENTKGD